MASILESLAQGLTITEYSDWLIFVERLNDAIRLGRAKRVPVLRRAWIAGEEWFLDPETDEVYVYVVPDSPVLPRWEKIDVLGYLKAPDPAPLSVFKVGQITVMTAHVMKIKLEALVGRGVVEAVPVPSVSSLERGTEKWFRDKVSGVVYRLSEYYGLKDADDIRWEVVPQSELGGKIQ